MPYTRTDIAYQGLFSSSVDGTIGVITTTSTNQVLQLKDGAGVAVEGASVAIEFVTACEISLDGSTDYHHFEIGKINLDRVGFDSIRVKDIGSEIRFWGLSV